MPDPYLNPEPENDEALAVPPRTKVGKPTTPAPVPQPPTIDANDIGKGLEAYGVRLARVAQDNAQAATAVTIIQLANALQVNCTTVEDVAHYLFTGRTTDTQGD